jgi:hypothetical protein
MVDDGDAEAPGDGGGLDDDQHVAAESRVRTEFSGSLWCGCWARTEVLWATVMFGRGTASSILCEIDDLRGANMGAGEGGK